jgi:peroxiredoxin/mono/diheme cytochrome c family protein
MSRRYLSLFCLGAVLAMLVGQPAWGEDKPPANLGKKVRNFTLTDPRQGSRVSLDGLKDKKALVVVFLGTECPINNAYLPTLAALHKEYVARGVAFLAINSNAQDTPAQVAEHARKHVVPFPVLKDRGSAVADLLEARRTPETFLLDQDRTIRYRGRIDDQFGVGYRRPKPTQRDLAEAIEEVLAGKAVTHATTPVAGCLIARVIKPAAASRVTYARDISRIFQGHCQECHRPGQIGPMPLLTYDDAVAWSATIREVVQEGRMPPWRADSRHGKFDNDRRLPSEAKDALLAWIDGGCPKGDDKDLPPPRTFAQGWIIGKPDVVLSMQEEFTVPARTPKDGVPYQYFSVPTNFKEDKWVVMAEAKAGAPQVVHHILVFIEPPGRSFHPDRPDNPVLCGAAPGDTALRLPAGVAKRVPAGSRLVFQMHYTPDGTARKDRASVGLIFAKESPKHEARTVAVLNPRFIIPPGEANHRVDAGFKFKRDGHLLGFMPHMHLRGKDFLYEAVRADGKKETLLSVPRYDFSWQSTFRLAEAYAMPKGSMVHCVAHFDNSARNPNNPDPTQEVTWGDQTWEEMMIGWMEIYYDK